MGEGGGRLGRPEAFSGAEMLPRCPRRDPARLESQLAEAWVKPGPPSLLSTRAGYLGPWLRSAALRGIGLAAAAAAAAAAATAAATAAAAAAAVVATVVTVVAVAVAVVHGCHPRCRRRCHMTWV